MTTTRWKLTAGGLVLALGGLAAVAGVPARSCQPDQKAGPVVLVEAPVAPVPIPVAVTPVSHQPPAEAPAAPAVPPEPTVPAVSTPAEASVLPLPVVTAEKKSEPKPAPKEEKVFDLPIVPAASPPAPTRGSESLPSLPESKSVPPPELKPTPTPPATPEPTPVPPSVPETKPAPPPPKPDPASAADPLLNSKPDPAPPVAEKKLKVCLQMGDDRPRFEVRDGDEVYLKVVCHKVDVKSPSDRGETMSTLKATGRVTFVTPGGEGTCEELTVIPGTGQVVVAGGVSFKYNWGKTETTVSGERMTFRLGSTPGASPVTVQASHQSR